MNKRDVNPIETPAGYVTFREVLNRYPISKGHLLFCILTGEIKTKKIGKSLYIDQDSINHFFECRWEAVKDSIKEEILRFRSTWNHLKDRDPERKSSNIPFERLRKDMLDLVQELSVRISEAPRRRQTRKSITVNPETLRKKLIASTRPISESFKSFIEMLTDNSKKNKK